MKTEVMIVNELNFEEFDHDGLIHIKGYNFEHDSLRFSNKCSHIRMWIKSNLMYERDKSLELDGEYVMAVRICFKNKQQNYLIGYYHQWSWLNSCDTPSGILLQ